jgi:thiol-disulfide isomerase/thioredoxin
VLVVGAIVVVVSASGSTASGSGDDPAEGKPAPDFQVPTLDGGRFVLSEMRGRPVWINVWATWCPPCRTEFPDIDEIRLNAEPDGLVFLAMNFGENVRDIEQYLANTGYEFTVGLDFYGEFNEIYRVSGLPTHVFVAADGTLAYLRSGGMTRDEMIDTVQKLLAFPPAAAAVPRERSR